MKLHSFHFFSPLASWLAASFCAVTMPSALGAELYWSGGAGPWDSGNAAWSSTASGPFSTVWNNANNDTATFGGTAGMVTLAEPITIGGLSFNTAGYTIGGGTLTFGTAGNIVAVADATVSSALTGSAAITKTGTGFLTLSGNNTYTGATIVKAGTLTTSGSLNGTTGTALTFDGTGTFNSAQAAGSSQGMGALTFGTGQGTVQSTYGGSGNTALTFSSLTARTVGAVGNLAISGGTNGSTNRIVLGNGATANILIDRGIYFGSSDFASYDTAGFVRAFSYTSDTNAVNVTTTGSGGLGVNDSTKHVRLANARSGQATAGIATLKLDGGRTLTISTGSTLTVNGIIGSGGTNFIRGATSNDLTTLISNGGNELTIRTANSTDTVSFANIGGANERGISYTGNGATTFSGPGFVSMRLMANNSTGQVTITGGSTVMINNGTTVASSTGTSLGTGNIRLDGGVINGYFIGSYVNTLGTDPNQLQITGGASGFGGSGWSINLGNQTAGSAASEIQWDSTAFNPAAFVLQGATISSGDLNFTNRLDLNGASRTIFSNGAGTSSATISGAIRTSTGTAGLIKTGAGTLILSNTTGNTYNGGTTINSGTLRFATLLSMPSTGNVTVNNGASIGVNLGTVATAWTTGTSGAGTLGGLLAGVGGQDGGTVTYDGNATLSLETTATVSYSGNIPNVGTSLSIRKTGGNILTLSGDNSYTGKTSVSGGTLSFSSIGNVGGGNSTLGAPATAANGTIDTGFLTTAATLSYTGSGHSSNRVTNLAGTTGGVTLEASGTGALALTSGLTATSAGAKILVLTGTNTGENSIATTSIPGLAEILTVQKTGAGTWRINGFSSPKNAWSISAGTLIAAGAITTGDQQVTVSGGTLAGVGPITLQTGKTLTVQAAGNLAPGHTTAGTLAVTGNLDISAMAGGGTGKLNFQIGAPAASDKITVTGTAQIGNGVLGFSDFVFSDLGGITSGTYVLLTATGGITGTLDPANRNGMIGSMAGTLQINGNNLEWSTDQDLDGLPDVYELANTSPPSTTALNPNDDIDNDGLTNMQEFLAGTGPNNADSDADGLVDGVETNTGTWVSASNTGTNPLVVDSDGDTIGDGRETNTGSWVSSTNTGTNPTNWDTDLDSFSDGVETNTGIFVSISNTGTSPLNADGDGDGAGDWYEVTASLTNPFSAASKPNVPYPLPDPDGSTGATNKPVKVYIMSGQSNMVGFGTVNGTDTKSLETMTRRQNKFPNLINGSGNYVARQDVHYRGVIAAFGNGPLAPGFGSNSGFFGPELGFGQIMGWHHDEPVLLLKTSQGNRGLGWDILPPGGVRYTYDTSTYPAYGESPLSWLTASGSEGPSGWYAGKQYDDFFLRESDMGMRPWVSGTAYPSGCQIKHNGVPYISTSAHTAAAASEPGVGASWASSWSTYNVTNVVDVLDTFATQYPQWAAQGFEIAGFVWWQGDKDRYDAGHATRYEQNLARLITSLRSYYSNRYPGKVVPNAPFVLATLGQTALNAAPSNDKTLLDAMLAVDGDTGKYPQFEGNVKTVYSYPLSEGGASNSHYNERAGTYMLVGDALGRAMAELETSITPGTTFADWINSFGVAPGLAGFDQDADGDGIENGAENFFGTHPGVGSSGLIASASGSNTFTFTHPQNANPATGVTAAYRWSKNLTTFFNGGQTDGAGTTVSFSPPVTNAGITTVTAIVSGVAAAKLFVDVRVTNN